MAASMANVFFKHFLKYLPPKVHNPFMRRDLFLNTIRTILKPVPKGHLHFHLSLAD